ncbi:MAG: HAD-IIIA family hydrolase [Deltaproteobacteria bacterium]|nr:HAD-IIIA family hydrolase [Deltaproteobacteria bacterium]
MRCFFLRLTKALRQSSIFKFHHLKPLFIEKLRFVINRNSPDYIKSWAEFKFLPGSIDAIKLLNLNGFVVIIITNQSVINRNMVSLDGLEYIHSMMKSAFKSGGGEIKDIFYCPHIPEDRCDCRKPEPGLIHRAQKTYNIDLANSVMAGDSVKDIMCARNAGCGHSILVKTGNGVALYYCKIKTRQHR